ncbi:TetR/AcrR family transcriptional regulator [Rhodococcoides corynebacterioides]|uniref:TetR/AcrR family transcriptional regulator n=1 Tax=Rhodococcoides corynebacterioides TaxID=53972 RepID=A0ABS7P3F8_9NOCA|nr:TetR/AcrR family transcriptional regulator [Rhodococcus corynebacterioides]MBY6366917.1 TetR/AcrR family transcriptional regulator [Rhodococcus corynebacterioides]MBY6407719.1 TetR/AcrR family transcriptional regulator [Rhodococcus corynebacterioides]
MAKTAQRSYAGLSAHDRRIERRVKFIDAAFTVFATTGFAASSVSEICSKANLSTRQFYEEFTGKEDILSAAYGEVNRNAETAVAEAAATVSAEPLETRLTTIIRAYLTNILRDPRHARVAFVEVIGVSDSMEVQRQSRVDAWIDLLNSLIATEVDTGELPARDYRLTWIGYIGSVNALVVHRTTKSPRTSVDDLVSELVRLARTGVLS